MPSLEDDFFDETHIPHPIVHKSDVPPDGASRTRCTKSYGSTSKPARMT